MPRTERTAARTDNRNEIRYFRHIIYGWPMTSGPVGPPSQETMLPLSLLTTGAYRRR
jgi:hypothetical protein